MCRQLLHWLEGQCAAPHWQPPVRANAPRRDVPPVRGGRRNLQSGLPRFACALPVRPSTDDEDQRSRRHQHAGVGPQTEDYWGHVNPIGIRSCYDEGKRCAETLFFDYHRQHKLRIKVARIFNTYGPRMHPNDGRVVSNFIVQALQGQDITVYGKGDQTRSFCYVDDLVEALIRLMGTGDDFTGPVNIGNPGEFTILQLAHKVIDITGSRSKIVFEPLPRDDPMQRQPNLTVARRELGWEPTTMLDEGLKRTIAYFDQRLLGPRSV